LQLGFDFDPSGIDRGKWESQKEDNAGEQGNVDWREIADAQTMKQVKARRRALLEELKDAEENHDQELRDKKKEELEKLEEFVLKATRNERKPKFRDEDDKIRDKYVQQIRRALDELKKHDQAAYAHFRAALRPIANFCYNPPFEIDWFLG
jgi:hypothetical protein